MPLTDTAIKKLKAQSKRYRKTDGDGLLIEVMPSGKKYWRYRFTLNGKPGLFTIGEYPFISLADARMQRNESKTLVSKNINPNEHKKEQKAIFQAEDPKVERMVFSELFDEWYKHNAEHWTFEHAKDIKQRIEKYLLPELANRPIEEIKPIDVVAVLKLIEHKGAIETLKRIKQYANRIFKYGVGMGYCEDNPVSDLPDDIFKKATKNNYAHTTDLKVLTHILNSIDSYYGDVSTKKALELQPYVFLRSKELAGLRWDEINLENRIIEISAERMKKKRAHLVPITSKVLEIIEYMKPISGHCEFLFPSPRTDVRPIGEQTLNPGLHRLGWKGVQTFHGFRHTASTLLNEQGFMGDIIEKQLAHEDGNKIRATYNKAQYLAQRKEMMQFWSDFLDDLKLDKKENV